MFFLVLFLFLIPCFSYTMDSLISVAKKELEVINVNKEIEREMEARRGLDELKNSFLFAKDDIKYEIESKDSLEFDNNGIMTVNSQPVYFHYSLNNYRRVKCFKRSNCDKVKIKPTRNNCSLVEVYLKNKLVDHLIINKRLVPVPSDGNVVWPYTLEIAKKRLSGKKIK